MSAVSFVLWDACRGGSLAGHRVPIVGGMSTLIGTGYVACHLCDPGCVGKVLSLQAVCCC